MLKREIFMALHFQQSAYRALEFKIQFSIGIQICQRQLGGEHELYVAVIKLIHQIYKAARLVVVGATQCRDIADKYGVIFFGQLNVIILRARAIADIEKIKPDNPLRQIARLDFATFDNQYLVTFFITGRGQ